MRDDTRAYYEEEARRRMRRELFGQRVELRDEYLAVLAAESRTRLVDFGAGPGGDVGAFAAAGLQAVGLDLAHGNGRLAAESGLTVIQGSLTDPPFRPGSFDAGWSMSTLMHLPEPEVPTAVEAMAAVLAPGAPLLVGVWGGDRRDEIDHRIEGERRLFSLRPADANRDLLAAVGSIERTWRWEPETVPDQDYQAFLVRIG